MPKDKHSPAGKLYRQLGAKGAEEHYRKKQQTLRRAKRIAALGRPETTAQKDRATYVSTTSTGPLSSAAWHKREGRSVSQSSLRSYRGYKRNFGR